MLDTPEIPLAAFDGLVFGPRSDMPIWQQIRDHILGLIEGGTLRGLSQTFGLNRMLTIGMEFAAPKVAERAHDSECYCREAEAPIKG